MFSSLTRRRFLACSAGLAALASLPEVQADQNEAKPQWGDLRGRLVYGGPPPERKKLKIDKDVEFCGKFDIRDESLMVSPARGLANVFVYLRSRRAPICPELERDVLKEVLLDNRDAIFQPHCLHLWIDHQELHVVNSDPIAQNVAFAPLGDKPANIVLNPAKGDQVESRWKFERRQSSPVRIFCNYHPWESAFVLPLDHPYADVSKADGSFCIAKLPVGTWQFQAWHERIESLDVPQWPKGRFTVTIKPGVNDLGTITIPPERLVKK